VAGLGRS